MVDGDLVDRRVGSRGALRYRVEGMDCPSCASKIETAVSRVAGTGDIRVNYGTQVLAFKLDEAASPRAAVEDQVRKLGYGIAPVEALRVQSGAVVTTNADENHGGSRQPWWQGIKARLAVLIGAMISAGFIASLIAPAIGHWGYLPAALLGLAFFAGRRSPRHVRAHRSPSRC